MQNGDIDNTVVPRLVIVWENLLALLPTKTDEAKAATYLKMRRWSWAARVYQLNDQLTIRIWDCVWRKNLQFEVVTFLPVKMVEPIENWIDHYDIPISRVWSDEPGALSRRLAYMPSVAAVYDPDPAHRLTYGSKGIFLPATDPELLGRL